jgi:hypothetical protein
MGNELQVMGLNIAICDDEEIIREQIKELIEKEIPAYVPDYMRRGMRCLPPGSGLTLCSLTYRWKGRTGLKRRKGSGRGKKIPY